MQTELIGLMPVGDQYYRHVAEVNLFSYEDLLTDKWGGAQLTKEEITSMNQIIRLTE